MHKKPTLGSYLKKGRLKAGLTADEVASRIRYRFPLNVLRWERNEITTLKLATLKKLIRLYKLDSAIVFDLLLQLKLRQIEAKLKLLEKKP